MPKLLRWAAFAAVCCLGLMLATACQNGAKNHGRQTVEWVDDYGQHCQVPLQPQRVVSLSPAVTEIIFALGADDLLAGRTDFCTYPPEAAQIASVGGISNINIEQILALQPDLVISGSMVPEKVAHHLNDMGVAMVCVIEKQSVDDLFGNIEAIGKLIGRAERADSLNRVLKSRIAGLDTEASTQRPTAYYVVGFGTGGNFTAGGNTFINDILERAGADNIARDLKGWNISAEALFDADPDFIVIRREDAEAFAHCRPYTELTAVRQGRIIPVESGTIDLQVPRNIDAILQLREAFGR